MAFNLQQVEIKWIKKMNIKVQIQGGASVKSVLSEHGNVQVEQLPPLTFIAYSNEMKARVLENFLKSPAKIGLSIFDGVVKDGEWHEDFAPDAIFNRS